MKMMEFYSKQINSNNYIGGVAFKTGDITNPFDAEF
jgi:hypothetical protein